MKTFIGFTIVCFILTGLTYVAAEKSDEQAYYDSKRAAEIHERLDRLEQEIQQEQAYKALTLSIIECETGGKHEGVWGDKNYPYPAYGIAQFQERTFNELKQKSGIDGDWKDRDAQIRLLEWSVRNGYADKWSCSKRAS